MTSTPGADWHTQADCGRLGDPELWFPKGTTGPYALQTDEAKAFCRDCPVALTCALWALETRPQDGIFGGLTPLQRRRISRRTVEHGLAERQVKDLVKAAWFRDTRDPLVDTYLARTIQGDRGHVWWRGTKTSVTAAGVTVTPAQLAFMVGHNRAPDGPVKAICGTPYCVAAEHLADGAMRGARRAGRRMSAAA